MTVSAPDSLRDLIIDALGRRYISESCQDAVQTGNHYQSVTLGDSRTKGFRAERTELLDRLDFRGRNVLDLGANLGELSRGARARGARLVDGFEYDPYFIEIANLVNAFNETTRVSFYERDITDPSIYRDRYDIVLAFSVFVYIDRVLDRLAEITDVLVIETHKLVGNLEETYVEPVSRLFPVHEMLGTTEWGTAHDESVERAVVVFAKDERTLKGALVADDAADATSTSESPSADPQPIAGEIDMTRTCLQERFFERFGRGSAEAVLAAVAAHPLDLDEQASTEDARTLLYSGWTYWFLLLRGWLQYRETGRLGEDNVYVHYLTRYYVEQTHDPGMARLMSDPLNAIVTAACRFRDLTHFRRGAAPGLYSPSPVRLWVDETPPRYAPAVYLTDAKEPLLPRNIDGWHRLFAARLFGAPKLPCQRVHFAARFGQMLGSIEQLSWTGDTIKVSGWCLHPERTIHSFELRRNDHALARANAEPRDDIRSWFGRIAHSRSTGFTLEASVGEISREPLDLELVPLSHWIAVARTSVRYDPGAVDEPQRPPPALGRRLMGRADPEALSARTARAVASMLTALPGGIEGYDRSAILEIGVDTGWLAPRLATLLPGASITGVGFDAQAVDWLRGAGTSATFVRADPRPPLPLEDDQFDLLVSWSTMSCIADPPLAWWAELHRLARRGAHVLVGIQGELLRRFLEPDADEGLKRQGIADVADGVRGRWSPPGSTCQTRGYTVSTCSDWFDVLDYRVGALDDLEDLIVMRKP